MAHGLAKDLERLPDRTDFSIEVVAPDGTDPLFDRNEVHEIYREWRQLFNQYDPPRVAVAEAWVHRHRRQAYASQDGLGQAFNFDLLIAPWNADEFKLVIEDNLELSQQSGSSSTWVMSNHDVIRHATRLVINEGGPTGGAEESDWYVNRRLKEPLDAELGLARAKAATLLILALPGSTYLYQGEELGLPEVIVLPDSAMQDPLWFRMEGKAKTRDGCRVPLPWTAAGTSFGFGSNGSHLPQPEWFADFAVDKQLADSHSTLNLYRNALKLRRELLAGEELEWVESAAGSLAFRRPGGWLCQTNFAREPVQRSAGEVILASCEINGDKLPGNSTVWLRS